MLQYLYYLPVAILAQGWPSVGLGRVSTSVAVLEQVGRPCGRSRVVSWMRLPWLCWLSCVVCHVSPCSDVYHGCLLPRVTVSPSSDECHVSPCSDEYHGCLLPLGNVSLRSDENHEGLLSRGPGGRWWHELRWSLWRARKWWEPWKSTISSECLAQQRWVPWQATTSCECLAQQRWVPCLASQRWVPGMSTTSGECLAPQRWEPWTIRMSCIFPWPVGRWLHELLPLYPLLL